MGYPPRLEDLEDLFGRASAAIFSISNAELDYLYYHSRICCCLIPDASRPLHCARTLELYTTGAPLRACIGFIDATLRGMCRPKKNQNINRFLPDDITIQLSGPIPGTRHDASCAPSLTIDDKHYFFSGDPAYGQQKHVVAPFKGASLSADETEFKKRMSAVRVSVEWRFGKVARYWAFVDSSKNQKPLLQRLKNIRHGCTISERSHLCIWQSSLDLFLAYPS
ncbi:hypothetical protein PHMEG_00016744 [Phytophthora megakarya]|uniref:DDE Tnp4 domain-containing protein n=1 Tax=Phytophthora megakarya TaxID=4795 RepID=A0A225W031_9STRA|nr:hypothetical protein PHMEG_00016744 [Phytophthora megakarya]